jgi:3'5'-cyclic nucleotide phosphodiesterase
MLVRCLAANTYKCDVSLIVFLMFYVSSHRLQDHPGVPNAQLVKEGAVEASLYKGKSIAEQNSFDRFWSILMSPKYEALRKTIYTTDSGLRRFRSLVVNAVLATDICDPDLKKLRNAKWDKAFENQGCTEETNNDDGKAVSDRKATIVIEHLMQASDVAHTMQHWHVYRVCIENIETIPCCASLAMNFLPCLVWFVC